MAVRVVTDSTSDIPPDLAESLSIAVVPCKVNFGAESLKDRVELSADEFYRRLVEGPVHPTTSQPSPGEFVEVFDKLGEDADGIVSVLVSSKLSGTFNSAVQARSLTSATCPVEVIDTAQASMGLGVAAVAAAQAAGRGDTVEQVAETARNASARAQLFFLVDTLDYLQKGGRIGKFRALVGTVLKIKPMIILRDGVVHELGKARTFAKARAKLEEVARGFAPLEALAVTYTTTPDVAAGVAESLRDLLPEGKKPYIARAGPTIGTYAGPGAVGIGLLQAPGPSRSDI